MLRNACSRRESEFPRPTRNGRFRYYTCYSRQRYGTKLCPAERLPADRLEAAVVKAMLQTYQRTDLFEQAVAQAHASAATNLEQFTSELATVQARRRRTEEVIGQYLRAFERGAMPEEVCGPRLVELQAEQVQLRDRERELRELLATNSVRAAPDPGMLAALRRRIYEGLTNGNPEARKGLLRTLVAEIVVESRNTIRPFFKVPALTSAVSFQRAVRELEGYVAPTGFEPALPP
jgi:site-specific DNA recombinase